MPRIRDNWGSLLGGLLIVACAVPAPAGDVADADSAVELGRRIFEHNFSQPDSWRGKQPLGDRGDGLGPQFNDVSCVACHRQGGAGGAGPQSKNIRILSYRPANGLSQNKLDAVARRAAEFHPDLSVTRRSTPLHSFHLPQPDDRKSYEQHLGELFDQLGLALDQTVPQRRVLGDAVYEISQRNTTAMWGAGEIEAFRRQEGNGIRQHLIEDQNRKYPWLSGRSPRTLANEESWFGWRGQIVSLHDFNLGACATEMGLTVTGISQHRSAVDSLQQPPLRLDLTDHQVLALTAFIAALPSPRQVLPTSTIARERVELGEQIFNNCHCNACHIRDLGPLRGIFSDLALHDMGPDDCDLMMANPEVLDGEVLAGQVGLSYYDSFAPSVSPPKTKPTNCECEWKTPPLWGCADSAPYLHDGRASSLDEAILWHGGEGLTSRTAYQQLTPDERSLLVEFLESLRAPQDNSNPSNSTNTAFAAAATRVESPSVVAAGGQPDVPAEGLPIDAPEQAGVAPPIELPALDPMLVSASAIDSLHELCLDLKPTTANTSRATQLSRDLQDLDLEPGAADFALALFLERSHQHSTALSSFRSASKLSGAFSLRSRQVLILDDLRRRDYSAALAGIDSLSQDLTGDSQPSARDAAESAQWLGVVIGWLNGPAGIDTIRYQPVQLQVRIADRLTEQLRAQFLAGIQQVQAQAAALQEERTALSGLEDATKQAEQANLAQKRDDLSTRQSQVEKSHAAAKTALDESLEKIDRQLTDLEKQYAEHDGIDRRLSERMAPLQFRSVSLLTTLARATPSRGVRTPVSGLQRDLDNVNAELTLLGQQREKNQTQLRLVVIKAQQLAAERSKAIAEYTRVTGKAAQELQSLSKWRERFDNQAAKLDDSGAGGSRRSQQVDRRIRDLNTYTRFDPEREALKMLARYSAAE